MRGNDGQQSLFELGTTPAIDCGCGPIIWPMDFFPVCTQIEHLSSVTTSNVNLVGITSELNETHGFDGENLRHVERQQRG